MIRHRQQPTERDLVALADGSLPAARRVRVERAVSASPELQAFVAAQRRALAAIDQAAGEQAPAALRARLELLREPGRSQARAQPSFRVAGRRIALPAFALSGRRLPLPAFRLARVIPAGAVAAAALVAVLVVTLGGGISAPTVAQASVLATRPAAAPVPRGHSPHGPTLVGVQAAGLRYPYWDDAFGFRAVGVRRDRFQGRPATTVFYQRGTQRVAYSIVSGAALRAGAPARASVWNGVAMRTLQAHGMRVVTWLRNGHSCVLSGRHVPFPVLISLAAWRA